MLTREPVIAPWPVIRVTTVEAPDDPPVPPDHVQAGQLPDSVLGCGHTGPVLGVMGHAAVLNHAEHQGLKLGVEVAGGDLADVGAHGLLVPGLGQRALRDAVQGGGARGVGEAGGHLARAVEGDAGGDPEEVRVSGGPGVVLAQPVGPHVQPHQHRGHRAQEEPAADAHNVETQWVICFLLDVQL